MASPLIKLPRARVGSTGLSTSRVVAESPLVDRSEDHLVAANFIECLPCVLYECNSLLELTYLSPNAYELIGIQSRNFLGSQAFWNERVLPDDLALLCEKIHNLGDSGSASILHRMIDDRGLPIWVSHSFRRVPLATHSEVIRGCMVPLRDEKRIYDLEQGAIARFIHKLGNHFQLLNLVINSLRKSLHDSRETEVLEQTVENAIALTRTFSEYCQSPTWSPILDFAEVVNTAAITRRRSFSEKGINFDPRLDDSLRGITVKGDPYLLELALGSVLENALEATPPGGTVALHATAEVYDADASVVRLRVVDSGTAIETKSMEQIKLPFLISKMNHDGLGLSMAVRFIEMHGGLLTIKSRQGQGTEVNITLPAGNLNTID